MKRFITGVHRSQGTQFPETLDDYITESNPVRVVEAFVEELDLLALGLRTVQPKATGRPGYHPSILLKIYLYGYLNRIQSSRRLEQETQRNVELMWLTGRLTPDFKTIADFRKDHSPAICTVCREFVVLCRQLNLFSQAVVAIDGSKFKAVNNREQNLTRGKLKRRMERIDKAIDRYFAQLDCADVDERPETEADIPKLKEKIAALQKKMRELKEQEILLEQTPDKQISITDPGP
jgi:transposase